MARVNTAVSFDDIIQADRNKKRNEALASQIFGKKKDKNLPTRPNSRPSDLASRITKRSSSVNSTGSPRSNSFNPPSRPSSTKPQNARSNRIASAITSGQANVLPSQSRTKGPGLSIKGKAGPFVVEARNFAPGTTAADIESALADQILDSTGSNGLLSCRLVSVTPTVVAEMIFTEKDIADRVISMYDKQKADGRILRLSLKPASASTTFVSQAKHTDLIDAVEPTLSDTLPESVHDNVMDDVEMGQDTSSAVYHDQQGHDARRAEPEVQDGRYGFDDSQVEQKDERRDDSHRDRDRDREYERERERDRERERPRESERERERDRDRDRARDRDQGRYERRPDRGSYRRDERPPAYNSRTSHYGNGVGAGAAPGPLSGRGSFIGGQGGFRGGGPGRMYSDDVMRGGWRGGPQGGFGGNYRGRGGY
ncbi:hypothetical protein LTR84_008349 [Exophiala bonariae]|uniref:RRM domain-containing protein n=1 Tax=Exophiala bonariae TaxID=1690606 RepID=A0AAV9N0Y2_9EURO|nr:hypothetical protein LTR84_008349 [Exophiala bonariae]